MSEKSKIPNDEIVNEITKDLEDQLIIGNNENVIEPKDTFDEDTDSDKNSEASSENNGQQKEAPDTEDLIDENKLKESESSLTNEEIECRKQQALDLKKRGNLEYKDQKYVESVITYTEALKICPTKYKEERAVLYANRAASKINMARKKSAIEDCTKSIELNDKYVRAYLRRAKLYEEEDKLEESLEDFKKVLEIDPGCTEAIGAAQRLPPKITEKNEKLKEEMLGKLKDLGNLILRPFGLSTNNFKLEQNPETGGYSVNFQQNQSKT